jgi:hypothetical protein
MKHYLVTGRMCGDDEDTHSAIEAKSTTAAIKLYTNELWGYLKVNDFEGMSAKEFREHRKLEEANGGGVFINGVFVSDTPIKAAI